MTSKKKPITKYTSNTSKMNGTLTYRVQQLEKSYIKLDDKMDLLMTNHLPHIQNEITRLVTRVNVSTAINVGAIIIGIVVAKSIT